MTINRFHFASSCLARLDAYLLSRLRSNHLNLFTRLLYRLRARRLMWRLSSYRQTVLKEHPVRFYTMDTARRVDTGVTLDEGVKRARGRVYAGKAGR